MSTLKYIEKNRTDATFECKEYARPVKYQNKLEFDIMRHPISALFLVHCTQSNACARALLWVRDWAGNGSRAIGDKISGCQPASNALIGCNVEKQGRITVKWRTFFVKLTFIGR